MFLEGEERWKEREKIGNAAQRKQVEQVNKDRTLADGTVLPWGSIVVLKMLQDRNDFGFPNLPCMVIGINHYKKKAIRYRLCLPYAVLQGTYGINQIWPCPQFDAQSVGFNYDNIKHKIMSETQAGEAFSASGGKLSHCQCMKDCLISKTCKCRKLKKFCGAKCHGGTGKNRFCRNCPLEWNVCCTFEPKKIKKKEMYLWTEHMKVNGKCESKPKKFIWMNRLFVKEVTHRKKYTKTK